MARTLFAAALTLFATLGARAETPEVSGSLALRTFLFTGEARVPAAAEVVGSSRLTFSPGGGDGWPSGGSPMSAGAAIETRTEAGLGHALSVQVSGLRGDLAAGASGARLGLRWAPIARAGTHLFVSGGVLRDLTGQGGAWGTLALEQSLGALRLASSLQTRHLFSQAADAVDVIVSAGADVALGRSLRAGLEYAGQDLEENGAAGRDGGPRHVLATVFSLRALSDRLSFSAGPALELGPAGPRPLGRLAALISF